MHKPPDREQAEVEETHPDEPELQLLFDPTSAPSVTARQRSRYRSLCIPTSAWCGFVERFERAQESRESAVGWMFSPGSEVEED
jgi:hypothetical protein